MSEQRQLRTLKIPMKIVLFGDAEVGKSSIVGALKEPPSFSEKYEPTIGVEFERHSITRKLSKYNLMCKQQLWDTAGQKRFRSVLSSYFRGSHALILVVDGTKSLNKENVLSLFREVKDLVPPNAKFYIVVSKVVDKNDKSLHSDFQNEEKLRDIASMEGINLAGDAIVYCSAKEQPEEIQALFDKVADDVIDQLKQEGSLEANLEREIREVPMSSTPQRREKISTRPSPPWSTLKKILVGNAVVGAPIAVTLFTLAAFAAGSFLTFGILPSAFIGAAIITAAALAVWNIGYGIYNWYSNREPVSLFYTLDNPPQTGVSTTTPEPDLPEIVKVNSSPLPKAQTDPKSEGQQSNISNTDQDPHTQTRSK